MNSTMFKRIASPLDSFPSIELSNRDILKFIKDLPRTSGAIEATREFAEQQGAIAISELEKLPESSSRNAIALVVEACIHRSK